MRSHLQGKVGVCTRFEFANRDQCPTQVYLPAGAADRAASGALRSSNSSWNWKSHCKRREKSTRQTRSGVTTDVWSWIYHLVRPFPLTVSIPFPRPSHYCFQCSYVQRGGSRPNTRALSAKHMYARTHVCAARKIPHQLLDSLAYQI